MSHTILKAVDLWKPENIILEESALEVVKSNYNTLVIAGPGSGKTELLAQRACFLLQTNTCPFSRRILAISFKRDSASNLEERISNRCGKELAVRLDSYTFDKFCKEILDRFLLALPASFRPNKNYRVDTNNELLNEAYLLAGFPRQRFNAQDTKPNYPQRVIDIMTKGYQDFEPALNFNLISRFAIYIIKKNPLLKDSLQKTYSHVFLDEFQDTTSLQYELVDICFKNTKTIITAVGDQKQRIMLWAGAMPNASQKFREDFCAIDKTMLMNHRSAPHLLSLQKALYVSLKEKEIEIIPDSKCESIEGQARISVFNNESTEREYIKEKIVSLLNDGINPREICILVKRSIDEYLGDILECDLGLGIKVRNEIIYQDLLKEDAVNTILAALLCAVSTGNPDAYIYLQDIDLQVHGANIDDSEKVNIQNSALNSFLETLSVTLKNITIEENIESLVSAVKSIFVYLGEKAYRDMYPQYENGTYFDEVIGNFCDLLWNEYYTRQDWNQALKSFEGELSVPAMTIHKSKGLEFDTVFVVGIEDVAFFANDHALTAEDTSAFFVAISRAKRNLYITTSKERLQLRNGRGTQHYSNVKVLYDSIKELVEIETYDEN